MEHTPALEQAADNSTALQQYKFNPEEVTTLTKQYLTLAALDVKSYKQVYVAHQDIKKKRIAVANMTLDLLAPHKEEMRKIKDAGTYIIGLLQPAEDHLEKTRKAFEKAKQDKKDARTQERINALRDLGCTYDNGYYTIGVIAVEAKQLTNMGGRKWKKLLRDVSDEAKRIAEEGARLKAIEDLLEERTRLLQAYGYEFHTDEPHFGQMTDAEFKSFSAPVIRAFYEKQNQPNKETTYGSAFENVDDHTAVAYLAKEIEHSPLNTFLKEVRDMVAATGEPSAEPERGIVITQRDKMADIIREECELLGVEFAGLDEATIEVIKNCMVSYHAKGGVEFQCEGCGDWDADVTKGGLCEICLEAKKNEEVADAGN